MDPATVIQLVDIAARLSVKIISTIYTFWKETRRIGDTLDAFALEIRSLRRIFTAITTSLSDPQLKLAEISTGQYGNQEMWAAISESVDDCRRCLEKLVGELEGISKNKDDSNFFRQAIQTFELQLRKKDIDSIRSQVQSHQVDLNTALQMLNVYVCCRLPMQLQENLAPQIATLDASVTELQASIEFQTGLKPRLHEGLDDGNSLPSRYFVSLQLKEAAQKVRIDASVVSAARSTIWGGSERSSRPNSGLREQATSILRNNVETWLSRPEQSVFAEEHTLEEKKVEYEGSISTSESFLPSVSSNDNPPAADVSLITMETESNLDDELDYELSQRLLVKAGKLYDMSLFEDAESVFREAFKQISSIHHSRRTQFNIAEASLHLARACFHQQKIDECEVILLDILHENYTDNTRASLTLDACFTLSELHLRRGNFSTAKLYCKKTVRGRRKLLGTESRGCYEAIQMLVYICTRSGERHEADAWSEMLPPEQRGYFPLSSATFKDDSYMPHSPASTPGVPIHFHSPHTTKDTIIELPGSQTLDQIALNPTGLRQPVTGVNPLILEESRSEGSPNIPTGINLNPNLLPLPFPKVIYDTSGTGAISNSNSHSTLVVRTWTDTVKGTRIKAEFRACSNGNLVLHKQNGANVIIPLTNLAPQDLKYIEQMTGETLEQLKRVQPKTVSDVQLHDAKRADDDNTDWESHKLWRRLWGVVWTNGAKREKLKASRAKKTYETYWDLQDSQAIKPPPTTAFRVELAG